MKRKLRECYECEAKIESVHPVNYCPNCGSDISGQPDARGVQPFEYFQEGDMLAAPTDDLDRMERGTKRLLSDLFPNSISPDQDGTIMLGLFSSEEWDKALKELKKP